MEGSRRMRACQGSLGLFDQGAEMGWKVHVE